MSVMENELKREIARRKKLEEKLRENKEKFRGIFEESVVAIYLFDNKKNFIDSNQAGLDLLGYSRGELLGMCIPDVDVDPVVVIPRHEQLLSGEKLVNHQHQLRRKNGKIITVLNNSRPITDVGGKVVGMQSTLIDISKRVRAEAELNESEKKYRALVQNSLEGISIAQDQVLKFANPAAEALFGYSAEELATIPFINLLHLDYRAIVLERHIKRLRGEKVVTPYSFKMVRKDGKTIWVQLNCVVIEWEKRPGVLCFHRDVSEVKMAQTALQASERKYRSMMESMKDPVYICTADFRVAYMNPAMIKRTGGDLTGDICHTAINGLNETCPWCVHGKVQNLESCETKITCPKDERSYLVSHSPLPHTDGTVSKMSVYRDIPYGVKIRLDSASH
jgi:PAS domain S-box-containing protein